LVLERSIAGEFQTGCHAIGIELARRGHTLVAPGCGLDDAEKWVLDGANAASGPDKKAKVIPFAPAIPGTQDLLIEMPNRNSSWPNLAFEKPFQTRGNWAVGQAVALIRSDAALLIGGGDLTANAGSLALELEKPYYAVGTLSGAAAIIADQDLNKHQAMGMPTSALKPSAKDPDFGVQIARGIEFLIRKQRNKVALRTNSLIFLVTVLILLLFLRALFRHDPFGNEAQLVYTTSIGAIAGVMLSFLIARFTRGEDKNWSALPGEAALACFLGVLYGFFTIEAGSLYRADIPSWPQPAIDSLAYKMALLGVAVGALLGPSSKRAVEELAKSAKLTTE
jgi:hypothetical protein